MVSLGLGVYKIWLLLVLLVLRWLKNATLAKKVCFRHRESSLFQRDRTASRLVSDVANSIHLSTRSTSRSLVTDPGGRN